MTTIVPFRPSNDGRIEFRALTDARWAEGRVTPLAILSAAEVKKLGGETALVSAFGEAVSALRANLPHSPESAAGRFAYDRAVEAFFPHQAYA